MKQILQNLRNGLTSVQEIPAPVSRRGHITIRTRSSLVSVGTEKMLVEFGKGNLLSKAMQQPDKVRQVVEKIKTDGLVSTLDRVRSKLDAPLPLGYCNVGVVAELGSDTGGFQLGDRVVSNGKHAELVVVPKNLCAKIPDNVDDETASFTVLAAIALQGIRLLSPTLGETFVVTGLGLIGLLAVQLLRANGCKVIGLDFDPIRRDIARAYGAEVVDIGTVDPVAVAMQLSGGQGVDGVLITASTTSNEPVSQAAHMCRKRGRIVLVGVVGLELSRADFYEKELSFQVSCSYGPGRYDPAYEEQGKDYPLPFVRWTEARNFSAVLGLMAEGRIKVGELITHRFTIDDAERAYAQISSGALGILLSYPRWSDDSVESRRVNLIAPQKKLQKEKRGIIPHPVRLGFLGAGNYAAGMLVPAFAKTGAQLAGIAAPNGVSSAHLARKFGFAFAASDNHEILQQADIDAVIISTRHDSHAELVLQAASYGKHVFVEKPLAISRAQLKNLEQFFTRSESNSASGDLPKLMVGFNRRYSPHIKTIKNLMARLTGPCALVFTINAGAVEAGHWTQDRALGGGRIIGEACHFVDLARFLAGSAVSSVKSTFMDTASRDSVLIHLGFANGSVASIQYLCNGGKSFPKERLEVFAGGGILQLDNFKKLTGFGWPGFSSQRSWKQDKGQNACASAFVQAIAKGQGTDLIPLDELLEVTRVCLDIDEHLTG